MEDINDANAGRDVDISITTREADRMIREEHINQPLLTEEEFDTPLGVGSGVR